MSLRLERILIHPVAQSAGVRSMVRFRTSRTAGRLTLIYPQNICAVDGHGEVRSSNSGHGKRPDKKLCLRTNEF